MPNQPRTAAATHARQQYAAERTAADPNRLGRAVRAVRAALAGGQISYADVLSGASNVVEFRTHQQRGGGDAA